MKYREKMLWMAVGWRMHGLDWIELHMDPDLSERGEIGGRFRTLHDYYQVRQGLLSTPKRRGWNVDATPYATTPALVSNDARNREGADPLSKKKTQNYA
jgi:hypothetical protein